MTELKKLYEAILSGDNKTALAVTQQAVSEGVQPMELITNYMIPAMSEVGRRFECEEYYVPELLLAARAMKGSLKVLRPLLAASGAQPLARVVIGTVKGDLHDIGKNLVAMMLEGAGFEIVDLGTDVPPEKFAAAVREHRPKLVGMSALLTTTMRNMRATIEAIEDIGLRDQVKVVVGGAPLTEAFAKEIGADGYAPDASRAVALAKHLS